MRVVSGFARGHKLICLEGDTVRPTSDRAKEAIFSSLEPLIRGVRFLDLFSGSGAIGIEALSRGAAHVSFVESEKRHVDIIQKNLAHVLKTIPDANYKVINKAALYALNDFGVSGLQFGIIFMDPPYNSNLWEEALHLIYERAILSENGIVMLEISKDERAPANPHFNIFKRKFYGRAAIYFMEINK